MKTTRSLGSRTATFEEVAAMRRRFTIGTAVVMAAIAFGAGTARAAETDTDGLPDGIRAKMSRIMATSNHDRGLRPQSNDDDANSVRGRNNANAFGQCGSLNVGNVQTGRLGQAPRQVNVIVTGDVVNANNKCGR